MATFTLTQYIDRPVAEVFDTVIHVEAFPTWSPNNHKSARRLSDGEIGEGARFEIEIKGFGKVLQTLEEFELNKRVRIVPHIKMLGGGHRFIFKPEGNGTRLDHELEMTPKGLFKLMTPMMVMMGKRNLREVTDALKAHLERAAR
jgi:uncharacterized protein YndB with AHSA1/START domain